jgi:hypothetical protein
VTSTYEFKAFELPRADASTKARDKPDVRILVQPDRVREG